MSPDVSCVVIYLARKYLRFARESVGPKEMWFAKFSDPLACQGEQSESVPVRPDHYESCNDLFEDFLWKVVQRTPSDVNLNQLLLSRAMIVSASQKLTAQLVATVRRWTPRRQPPDHMDLLTRWIHSIEPDSLRSFLDSGP